jgi:acyl carrier protein
MRAEIREFVITSLQEMNYDVEGITDETTLGPSGVDLESLALADLAVRVEDQFGVKFADDESEQLALMTVGEFTNTVADRVGNLNNAGQASKRARVRRSVGRTSWPSLRAFTPDRWRRSRNGSTPWNWPGWCTRSNRSTAFASTSRTDSSAG